MGKDKREWRKLVKKLRRSRIRKAKAQAEELTNVDQESFEIIDEIAEEEKQALHELEEANWLERERLSIIVFEAKKAKEEAIAKKLADEKEKIRLEWEKQKQIEAEKKKEAERIAMEKQAKQVMVLSIGIRFKDEEFNQLLEFLSGDIETPPLPYLMPEPSGNEEEDPCLYFSRTGACRFFERCKKPHPTPTLSTTILISNFFTHISLEQNPTDDTDSSLEYEDSELRREFLSFYEDVLPEFKKFGIVQQFKVCRNIEPHLRGNVYIQYKNIREAVETYRKFNGRFYNGRQLTLRFVKLESWRNAICGQFTRGFCVKGKSCNYLHVFKNPTREFIVADNDWQLRGTFRSQRNPFPHDDKSKTPRKFYETKQLKSPIRTRSPRKSSSRRDFSKHRSANRSTSRPRSPNSKFLESSRKDRKESISRSHKRSKSSKYRTRTKSSEEKCHKEKIDLKSAEVKSSKKKSKKHKNKKKKKSSDKL